MLLYVLVPMGNYQQGIIGVYDTAQAAHDVAKAIWPETDGYHEFVVHPREINVTYEDQFSKIKWEGHRKTTAPFELTIAPEPRKA